MTIREQNWITMTEKFVIFNSQKSSFILMDYNYKNNETTNASA